MAEINCLSFDKEGLQNTEELIKAVKERAKELENDQIVVATTTGKTALDCAKAMPNMKKIAGILMYATDSEIKVTRKEGKIIAPNPDYVNEAKKLGVEFYQGILAFSGVTSAIKGQLGGCSDLKMIAEVYKTISVGTKVAVECSIMAADGGLIDTSRDIIALGGWRGGADTAIVLKPAFARTFFDLKIREFIALPRNRNN
jgi:hypothetical protein